MTQHTKLSSLISPDEIILVHSGKDYFSRLEQMINQAERVIHIQTYIFEYDETGHEIIKALKRAAARNVSVYILLDSFGSREFPSVVAKELESIGIKLRFFSPFLSLNTFYIGRRLHQKIVAVDGETLLIGGINVASKYEGSNVEKAWLDYAVMITSGMAKQVDKICFDLYFKRNTSVFRRKKTIIKNPTNTEVRILQNDWLNRKNEIFRAYIHAIRNAKKDIIIVGSYFFPSRKLSKALKLASEKNVKVKLILSGKSDIPLLKNATLYFYGKYLKNNIEIFEWDKSILHGKAAVVDGEWSTIGSFNLNNLSSYASIEMNLGIHSQQFSANFQTHLNLRISECVKISSDEFEKKRTFLSKIKIRVCYWIIRLILNVATIIPYKRFLKSN